MKVNYLGVSFLKFIFAILTLTFCSVGFAFNIHPGKISVPGLSFGAYMAGQLQIAHSGTFSGIRIFAGDPYYCSVGSIGNALNSCWGSPDSR